MPYLVYTIMGLILSAFVMFGSVQYTPITSILSERVKRDIIDGVSRVERGLASYLVANRDLTGTVVIPAAGHNLLPSLLPGYLFLPKQADGFEWLVYTGNFDGLHPGVFVCASPTRPVSEGSLSALERARNHLGSAAVLSLSCGDSLSAPGGTHLTYWLIASHYNAVEE